MVEAKELLQAPDVRVQAGAYNKLVVDWKAVKSAEKYFVYRSETEDGTYESNSKLENKQEY